jgi:hypothetical protein
VQGDEEVVGGDPELLADEGSLFLHAIAQHHRARLQWREHLQAPIHVDHELTAAQALQWVAPFGRRLESIAKFCVLQDAEIRIRFA